MYLHAYEKSNVLSARKRSKKSTKSKETRIGVPYANDERCSMIAVIFEMTACRRTINVCCLRISYYWFTLLYGCVYGRKSLRCFCALMKPISDAGLSSLTQNWTTFWRMIRPREKFFCFLTSKKHRQLTTILSNKFKFGEWSEFNWWLRFCVTRNMDILAGHRWIQEEDTRCMTLFFFFEKWNNWAEMRSVLVIMCDNWSL